METLIKIHFFNRICTHDLPDTGWNALITELWET